MKSCVVKKELNINLYRDVLFSRKSFQVSQNGIRSYKHQLYTETVKKIALSATDDKLYIHNDNIRTRNFGHWRNNVENFLEKNLKLKN